MSGYQSERAKKVAEQEIAQETTMTESDTRDTIMTAKFERNETTDTMESAVWEADDIIEDGLYTDKPISTNNNVGEGETSTVDLGVIGETVPGQTTATTTITEMSEEDLIAKVQAMGYTITKDTTTTTGDLDQEDTTTTTGDLQDTEKKMLGQNGGGIGPAWTHEQTDQEEQVEGQKELTSFRLGCESDTYNEDGKFGGVIVMSAKPGTNWKGHNIKAGYVYIKEQKEGNIPRSAEGTFHGALCLSVSGMEPGALMEQGYIMSGFAVRQGRFLPGYYNCDCNQVDIPKPLLPYVAAVVEQWKALEKCGATYNLCDLEVNTD